MSSKLKLANCNIKGINVEFRDHIKKQGEPIKPNKVTNTNLNYVKTNLLLIVFVMLFFTACRKTHVTNDICDCANTQSTYIIDGDTLFVPNLFTPNGDGLNDQWYIKNIDKFSGITIKVNRPGLLGGLLYEYKGNGSFWDGDNDKRGYKDGKYKYQITYNGSEYSGYVCIYRGDTKLKNDDCLKSCVIHDINDPVVF